MKESTSSHEVVRPRKGLRTLRLTPIDEMEEPAALPDKQGEIDLTEIWPWLEDEPEENPWAYTDPLQNRNIPTSNGAATIEAEDIRRARADGSLIVPVLSRNERKKRKLRRIVLGLLLITMMIFIVDGILVSFVMRNRDQVANQKTPIMTASTNIVQHDQTVTLHVQDFPPGARVFLTHDTGEPVYTDDQKASLQVGENGDGDVSVRIGKEWSPGFHTVVAEDEKTRYVSSISIQVGGGPLQMPHLVLEQSTLQLGHGSSNLNALFPLQLRNSGGGSLTWTAKSDQSWLKVMPTQGSLSNQQTVLIGGERFALATGEYQGSITFCSSNGDIIHLPVSLQVDANPNQDGLGMNLSLLSFTAQDGDEDIQDSQLVQLRNTGNQPLYWQSEPTDRLTQDIFIKNVIDPGSWLYTEQNKGMIPPQSSIYLKIGVHNRSLLAGNYVGLLKVNIGAREDSLSQTAYLGVILNIQSRCGLSLPSASLQFTIVRDQAGPADQPISLNSTETCRGNLNWNAMPMDSWLSVTPAHGSFRDVGTMWTKVHVNTVDKEPGTYNSSIVISTGQMTQLVNVQLVVQSSPDQQAPVLQISTSSLNFSATLPNNPPEKVVTLRNTGATPLHWVADSLSTNWFTVLPANGTLNVGESADLTVTIDTSKQSSGSYNATFKLTGFDDKGQQASGSPQTVNISLTLQGSCVISLNTSAVSFTAKYHDSTPLSQTVNMVARGDCRWPLLWKASVQGNNSWLTVPNAQGNFASSNQSQNLSLRVLSSSLQAGQYNAQAKIEITDMDGKAVRSLSLNTGLTVISSCVLNLSSRTIDVSVQRGSTDWYVPITIQGTGGCNYPLYWSISLDNQGQSWLSLDQYSGEIYGDGDGFSFYTTTSNLKPGIYHATITVFVHDNQTQSLNNNGQTINVTLRVL